METLKFKVGDKVRVKSLEWYNEKKDSIGHIPIGQVFTDAMSKYCGSILTIKEIFEDFYIVNENTKNWQDWMLEDEVVTEEKQEVEQLIKNNMETKEMTEEEVFVYLGSTKILCASTEETAKVQEKLFELGMSWIYDGKNIRKDKYLLFINKKQELQYCSDIEYWMKDVNRRIEPSEILAIQIKEEEKPKFDPKTLQDFQKVLYRSTNTDWWRLGFFENYNEDKKDKFGIVGQDANSYEQCVPYNEETESLKGKCLDAPDFYKNW